MSNFKPWCKDGDDDVDFGRQIARSRELGRGHHQRAVSNEFGEEDEFEGDNPDEENAPPEETAKPRKRKRAEPEELTAKRAVGRFRQVVPVPKVDRRDPRFEATSGEFKQDMYDSAYRFLSDYKASEIVALKDALKSVKDPDERREMAGLLSRMQQQRADDQRRSAVQKVSSNIAKESRQREASGGNAYFLKKRDLRELAAVERFKQLESRGGNVLDKAMAKKRKKVAGKDRKKLPRAVSWMPKSRAGAGEERG